MRLHQLIALLALGALAGQAQAGARQQGQVLLSEDPGHRKFQEQWGYADAVVSGDTVYLSGVVVGLRPDDDDLKAAYERTFRDIGRILTRSGVGWDDVVDITSYHTDLTTQMPAIVEVKNRYVKAPPPAWTAIEVARLIPDRGITEIKIVAKRSSVARR
jgi:enamine deaminase RidA (YjgF/YER057c/UK114 family)